MVHMTLKTGSNGPEVRRLQTMLNKVGHVTPPLRADGGFGPKTYTAVVAFQKQHHLGQDGIVGPKTWDALENKFIGTPPANHHGTPPASHTPASSDLIEEAVRTALSQNGVMEDPLGSNRGSKVDEYNRTAGAPEGSYWCMSFVYWSYVRASAKSGKANPMPKTAYCPFLYNWGNQHHKLTNSPRRGDIFLVKGGPNGHKHTGLVTGGQGGQVETVEGNTNNDGSHNGIGVFLRHRSSATCDFVRLG